LKEIDVNETEFLLLLQFFNRSADYNVREKMIELCGLSTIMEPSLIRGLFSVASPFDLPPIMRNMILKENDLTKEYKIHY
jgi:hypothetical protein